MLFLVFGQGNEWYAINVMYGSNLLHPASDVPFRRLCRHGSTLFTWCAATGCNKLDPYAVVTPPAILLVLGTPPLGTPPGELPPGTVCPGEEAGRPGGMFAGSAILF